MTAYDSPRLIADIGGTFARFALETAPGQFQHRVLLRSADFADFHGAISTYRAMLPASTALAHAAVAIANPVEGDEVRMTNYHWHFSIEEERQRLALDTLVVVNDFTALAMAVPRLGPRDWRAVGGGAARQRSVIGVLGAGTGLGVSGLIPADDGWVALGTEGGHANVAPRDDREIAILRHAMAQFGHVSFERLLSGPGLELIHKALAIDSGRGAATALTAPQITAAALSGADPLAVQALEVFCALLGTAAANLAVTLGALGGIYIGGGIVPRMGTWFDRSPFRQRFEDKGRFSDYLRRIPTYVITAEDATFTGASAILQGQLTALGGAPRSAILDQIRRGLSGLSPAERRVAEQVLAHPRALLSDPIADIARAAQVSQPTVIRFCRSLGCEGLSDFKLRLASSLTGTVPITHTQVSGEDSSAELGDKVLANTAGAILQLRDALNRDTIAAATALLDGARRIEIHAVGHYSVVAVDAQYKFLRLGIACQAVTDPRLQVLSAAVLGPEDVALVISGSGNLAELLAVADKARERGAAVVAITAGSSALARRADVALIIDHGEDVTAQLPMISRILHLLAIDILAVGMAMRRSGEPAPAPGTDPDLPPVAGGEATAPALPRRRRTPPGVSTATPMKRLTSHSA